MRERQPATTLWPRPRSASDGEADRSPEALASEAACEREAAPPPPPGSWRMEDRPDGSVSGREERLEALGGREERFDGGSDDRFDGGSDDRFDGGSDDRLETVCGKEERDEWPGVEEAREERRLRPPPPRCPRRLTPSASRSVG